MVGGQFGADVDQIVRGNAEFDELRLRFDVGGSKVAAHRLRRILDLGSAGAQLDSGIAVLVVRALGYHLAVFQPQYCYRDMLAGVVVDARHSHFLCNHT
ncbi:hypothetical protein D3C87_1713370 [compost metagenome]